jgi:hypothetical protein
MCWQQEKCTKNTIQIVNPASNCGPPYYCSIRTIPYMYVSASTAAAAAAAASEMRQVAPCDSPPCCRMGRFMCPPGDVVVPVFYDDAPSAYRDEGPAPLDGHADLPAVLSPSPVIVY